MLCLINCHRSQTTTKFILLCSFVFGLYDDVHRILRSHVLCNAFALRGFILFIVFRPVNQCCSRDLRNSEIFRFVFLEPEAIYLRRYFSRCTCDMRRNIFNQAHLFVASKILCGFFDFLASLKIGINLLFIRQMLRTQVFLELFCVISTRDFVTELVLHNWRRKGLVILLTNYQVINAVVCFLLPDDFRLRNYH